MANLEKPDWSVNRFGFQVSGFGCQEQISKPNPKLYQKACEDVGVEPSEVAYIGDNPTNNVDPPNKIGITTFLMKRKGKYKDTKSFTSADYTVKDFNEILEIFEKDFVVQGL